MKLVRFGAKGKEKPGLIDKEGKLRDLSGVIADITPEQLAPAALARLTKLDPSTLPLVKGKKRFGVPLNGVRKFLAIGLNYSDHAAETGATVPPEPIIFMKATSAICGPNDPIVIPSDAPTATQGARSGALASGGTRRAPPTRRRCERTTCQQSCGTPSTSRTTSG